MSRSLVLMVLVTLAIPASAAGQEPAGKAAAGAFTIDDAIDLVRISAPRISPDGERVVYTRAELDWAENERPARLWIADADGGDARPLTAEAGDTHARWSPDGRRVAFLRSVGEKEKSRQVFLLRMDGGEAWQLTTHPTSVRRFEWTPDSRALVFLADDSLSTEEKKARKDGADAVFVDEGPNGQGRGAWSNLWRVEVAADTMSARPITAGERVVGDFAVSPDGRSVAFTFRTEGRRNDGHRSEIAVVEAGSGEIRQLTRNEAPESRLAWSPDGRTLAFVAPDLERWELDQGNLYLLDTESGENRPVATDFQGELGDYAWTPDGRAIHFVGLERTVADLYRLDVRRDRVRRVSELGGVVRAASFSADHGAVAYLLTTPTLPGDVFVSSTGRFDPVRVTDANAALRARILAEPEVVRWRSEDGLEIEGLLYRPEGAVTPGAFVLEIHGGPAGVFTRSFDTDAQVLAAHGYVVLQPNVRGSTGYGDALLRGNMRDIGGGDFQDLMTGVDAMIRRGVAHEDSLAVKGWSYGGILGGWTITRTDRFKAASLGAMVSDWRSEFGPGFNFDVVRWYLGGDPWSNRDFWIERSSYTHLDRVRTPSILFHGDDDRVDTIAQSFNFAAGLRHHGVPVRFVRFPREGHGIREPRHARTRLVEELRWFQRFVRGDADWQAPARPEAGGGEKEVAAG